MHEQFGAARAHETADAEDFAGAQREADVAEKSSSRMRIGDAEVLNLKNGLRPASRDGGETDR